MSEQGELASLQEEIRHRRNQATILSAAALVSFVLAFIGLATNLLTPYCGWSFLLGIVGAIGFIVLSVAKSGVNGKKNELMGEANSMCVKTPTCPKCGRELRQEGLSFCPYCGSPLIWRQ